MAKSGFINAFAVYFTTILIILFGTYISFTIVLPSMKGCMSGTLAVAIASSFEQFNASATTPRSLPFIWTAISTVESIVFASSYLYELKLKILHHQTSPKFPHR